MKDFGLINKLNGLDNLPYWPEAPCNSIRASEGTKLFFSLVFSLLFVVIGKNEAWRNNFLFSGSFFPPRDRTKDDMIHVWDKDLCRVMPLQYRGSAEKTGIPADLYTPPDDVFDPPSLETPDNECYCPEGPKTCPPKGLQDISPCQYSTLLLKKFQ